MDLADQVDDYICSFEGLGDITMDSLALFIFLWAVLMLCIVGLYKYVYKKYDKTKDPNNTAVNASSSRQGSAGPSGVQAAVSGAGTRSSEPRDTSSPIGKLEVKETLSKPTSLTSGGGRGIGATPGAGTGKAITGISSAQPGGTLRRRMVRQGSAGPENRRKRYVPPPSNVVGPETTSVTWTSQVFRWLYTDLVICNELLMSWVIAVNDTLRKLTAEQGIAVEAIRVLPDSPPPALSNIFCNADESNPSDMLITFDCDAMPVLQVKTTRHKAGKLESNHYKVTVSRFRARLANTMNYNSLKGEMRVEGYPDIRINMNSVGPVKPVDPDEQQFENCVTDILARALQDTIYPVDFSMHSTCPRGELELQDLPNQMSPATTPRAMISGRRLLVKIVAGDGLKDAVNPYVVIEMDEPAQKNQTAKQPGPQPQWDEHFLFDLSPQSAEILFEVYDSINETSGNAGDSKFLGLGLVGIDELAIGPAITQILTLQPRPYETQNVYGSIIVDFVFIEGAEIPVNANSYQPHEALHISTPAITEHIKNGANLADAAVRALQEGALSVNNGQPSKSTLIIHSVQRNSGNLNAFTKIEMNKGADEMALNEKVAAGDRKMHDQIVHEMQNDELDGIIKITTVPTTSTTKIDSESISQATTPTAGDNEQKKLMGMIDGNMVKEAPAEISTLPITGIDNDDSVAAKIGHPRAASTPQNMALSNNNNIKNNCDTAKTPTNATEISSIGHQGKIAMSLAGVEEVTDVDVNASVDPSDVDERGRSKKRNFFGTLKKRLSRSKTRTHDRGLLLTQSQYSNSALIDPTTTTTNSTAHNASTHIGTFNGESRSLSVDRAVLSLGRRTTAGMSPNSDHSRRSSFSESSAISGFSTATNRTYIHEASTLVLETIENGITRHFIVPLSIAQRPRWRRKGTKLHIYNDHTFIAKHLSGSGLQCAICSKSIPRRPGKQGYECRDCHMICHKQCHIRAPLACPNPTALSMELNSFPVLTENDLL